MQPGLRACMAQLYWVPISIYQLLCMLVVHSYALLTYTYIYISTGHHQQLICIVGEIVTCVPSSVSVCNAAEAYQWNRCRLWRIVIAHMRMIRAHRMQTSDGISKCRRLNGAFYPWLTLTCVHALHMCDLEYRASFFIWGEFWQIFEYCFLLSLKLICFLKKCGNCRILFRFPLIYSHRYMKMSIIWI